MLIISSLQLSSHLTIGLPSGLFTSGFPIRNLYTRLFFPTSSQCLHFITITLLGEQQKSRTPHSGMFCSILVVPLPSAQTSSSKPYSRTCYSCLLIFTAKHNRVAITFSFPTHLSTNSYAILECTYFALILSHSSQVTFIIKIF